MDTTKSRHWCFTAWLAFAIIGNVGMAIVILKFGEQAAPSAPAWAAPLLLLLLLFNLICIIALFKWKKWGFWGFLLGSVIGVIIESTANRGFNYGSLIGLLILLGVLHIGKANKAWPQLE